MKRILGIMLIETVLFIICNAYSALLNDAINYHSFLVGTGSFVFANLMAAGVGYGIYLLVD